ncbi:universal stress protein [Streptomyces sp. NPDC045714]|uniref:universal stress protein n=1 Tax=Streptomyces sp. NPDC045714 TaxID=3154913 RepID=UPI0033E7F14B
MLRPVIVGIDGSPEGLAAAGWAAREAQRHDVALHLVHAWTRSPYPSAVIPSTTGRRHWARRILREAHDHLGALYPHLPVEEYAVEGFAPDVLLDASAEGDLLVLGSRSLGGSAGYLAGSVALHLTTRSPTPVVLVRAGEQSEDAHQLNAESRSSTETPYREIVLGMTWHTPATRPSPSPSSRPGHEAPLCVSSRATAPRRSRRWDPAPRSTPRWPRSARRLSMR